MTIQQDDNLNLRELQQQLQQALALIELNNIDNPNSGLEDVQGLSNTQSLLQRCEKVALQGQKQQKPMLRIIHHFACSGGTLISKCIAAQPNVFLLSELHPTTRLGFNTSKGTYTPRDVITQALYAGVPEFNTLAEDIFVENVIATERHVSERGGYLVLRAHTHSDYCTDAQLPGTDTLTRLLSPYFEIKHLVTVRNPIDSFLSLRKNGWVHFKPDSFDEYCGRLLKFLAPFSKDQVVKYEDFVEQPELMLTECLSKLALTSVEHGLDYIEIFKISGDSGRGSFEISARPRRGFSEEYLVEITSSNSFKNIFEFLGYCV